MRWFEIAGGFNLPVSNEEQKIVDKIGSLGYFDSAELNERELEIAKRLVGRGVINRESVDGKRVYTLNMLESKE